MAFADYDFTLAANGSQQLPVSGSVVRVRSSSGTLRVSIDGGPGVRLSAGQGFRLSPGQTFRDVTIRDVSGAANTGVLFIGDAGYEDTTFSGNSTIIKDNSNRGGVYQTAFSVGTASQSLHIADPGRAWFAISNESDTATIWVYVDQNNGAAASTANGKRIGPGEMWEPAYCPLGNIRVISDTANTKVLTFIGIY